MLDRGHQLTVRDLVAAEFVAFGEYLVDMLLGDFSVWADEKRAASVAGEGTDQLVICSIVAVAGLAEFVIR